LLFAFFKKEAKGPAAKQTSKQAKAIWDYIETEERAEILIQM
jgi:hypothetical protein